MHNDVPLAVEDLSYPDPARTLARELEIGPGQWELYYAVVYAVCAVIVEVGPLSPAGRVISSVALAAMVPWYLLVGRPMMKFEEAAWEEACASWRGPVYLTGILVLFAAVESQNLNTWFLAFALTPQCFHVASVRRGMAFVVALNVVAGLLVAVRAPGLENAMIAIGIAVFAIGFSFVYSRFAVRIIEQNIENTALIAELSSARLELATVHHEAGVLAERHRLAGEIHDTLAQGFTSIVTLVQAAEAGLDPDASGVRRHLDMALATARENLAEARALVTTLSPARLESSSLGDALRRVAEATGAETGIRACAEVAGAVRPLPTSTEVVLLRVCQEALANVRKHARAQAVSVLLCYADDRVELNVSDDGTGFEVAAVNGGYGLRGMRDRVAAAGGTVRVTSASGTGTTVLVELPA